MNEKMVAFSLESWDRVDDELQTSVAA